MTKLSLIAVLVGCGTDPDPSTDVDAAVRMDHADADAALVPDAPPPCSAMADTCTGESICIAGACEAAFGRLYDIRALSVTLPTTDPDGLAWDFAGGAPDIFVTIAINGVAMASTFTVNDQFSAAFPGPYTVQPVGGGSLLLAAYDEDITVNDLAYICRANPLTADLLRARRLACAGDGYALSFAIEPR